MTAEKKKQMGVLGLIIALVVVLFGGVLFVGAVSGWFDGQKVTLDAEYYGAGGELVDLTATEYGELVQARKSFVVFVDQGGCTTADRLRQFVTDYATEKGFKVYRMMFSEVKQSSLHVQVKYYPSEAILSKGSVCGALQADSDADAPAYNDYAAFQEWIRRYL
ncbi:hypothetical protein IJ135_00655 [Candidatus Saccharibacteria bacterium]|nr:hypothetical protein [Candidatus Saccharibacteria bacterium]